MDKILESFIINPEKEFHVRGISKISGKSPTTISKYLKKLAKDKILISERKFNHLLFRANVEGDKYKRLKLDYNLDKLYNSGLIDYLVEEFNHPEAIVLFGSFAKAQNIERSDVDLLIISGSKKHIELEKYEKKLGHEIQLFVHSVKDIEFMKEKNGELLNSFINGIVVNGYFEVFR